MSGLDFSRANKVLQHLIDQQLLPGACAAVSLNGELIDLFCAGMADIERGEPLRRDHIHRAFSNTKLMTSVLALMFVDDGALALDAPVANWIPALAKLRVMRPGAASITDTEPLREPITVRHLLSHQAGFSHGVFDIGTPIYDAYMAAGARGHDSTLTQLMDKLAGLPLLFQPGQGWTYSLATDVLARLCEVVGGAPFGELLQQRLFGPLCMVDSGFVLRPDQAPRLAALYRGDANNPLLSGLKRLDNTPWPGAYLEAVARQSGAGGAFSTLDDMLALLGALRPGPQAILKPGTLAGLYADQLPAERCVGFPASGAIPSMGFSLAGAITREASALAPAAAVGELQWGGLAGTHWFISPSTGLSGVLMTQRFMGFWHPLWFQYKRRLYEALGQAQGQAPG